MTMMWKFDQICGRKYGRGARLLVVCLEQWSNENLDKSMLLHAEATRHVSLDVHMYTDHKTPNKKGKSRLLSPFLVLIREAGIR